MQSILQITNYHPLLGNRERVKEENMKATEAKRKLCELRSSLRDKEADKAIWIAIRAIDTCTKNGFIVED